MRSFYFSHFGADSLNNLYRYHNSYYYSEIGNIIMTGELRENREKFVSKLILPGIQHGTST